MDIHEARKDADDETMMFVFVHGGKFLAVRAGGWRLTTKIEEAMKACSEETLQQRADARKWWAKSHLCDVFKQAKIAPVRVAVGNARRDVRPGEVILEDFIAVAGRVGKDSRFAGLSEKRLTGSPARAKSLDKAAMGGAHTVARRVVFVPV